MGITAKCCDSPSGRENDLHVTTVIQDWGTSRGKKNKYNLNIKNAFLV